MQILQSIPQYYLNTGTDIRKNDQYKGAERKSSNLWKGREKESDVYDMQPTFLLL